jgi:hypothetical protein
MAQLYRVMHNEHLRDSERLGVTIDMILDYHRHMTRVQCSVVDEAVYTAELLGFTTVARVSEYLETHDKMHLLVTDRVVFETAQGVRIPAYMVTVAHVNIVAVTVDIHSKKNDQKRRGFKFYFSRAKPGETYCIVSIILRYVLRAHPVRGQSFFYIPDLKWTLRPSFLNKKLKDMARFYKIDEARVSSHSLRIGGATTLSAAGLSNDEVKRFADWHSDALLLYLRRSILLFERARQAMSSPAAMTVADTRRLYVPEPVHCISNDAGEALASKWKRLKGI